MQAVYASNAKGFHLTFEAVFPAPCVRKESQNCEDKMSPITRRSRTIVFFLPSQILICCLAGTLPPSFVGNQPSALMLAIRESETDAQFRTGCKWGHVTEGMNKAIRSQGLRVSFKYKDFLPQIMRKCTSGWSCKHKPRLGLLYLDWTAVNEIKHQLVSTAPCVTCPLSSDTICPFWRGLNEVRWPLTSISCPS